MRVGVAVGVLIGILIGASAAFATTNFVNGDRFLRKTDAFQEGYVTGVSDMIFLVGDTGMRYITGALNCFNRNSKWDTSDVLRIVKAGLAANQADAQYSMASNVSEYLSRQCR